MLMLNRSFAFVRRADIGIEQQAGEDPDVSLFRTSMGPKALDLLPNQVRELNISGIIGFASNLNTIQHILATGLPAVNLSAYDLQGKLPCVTADNRQIGQQAAEHLMGLNLHHFSYVEGQSPIIQIRNQGFRETLARHGLKAVAIPRTPPWNLAREISSRNVPMGIFVSSDLHARKLVDELENLQIPVPDTVAVICGDDGPEFCRAGSISITSIPPAGARVGREAVLLLKKMIGGYHPQGPLLIPPDPVIQRDSTARLNCEDPKLIHAIRYLRTHACAGIGVQDIVENSGLSRSSIERKLRNILGHSPHHEIRRIQLEKAVQLLRNTRQSVAEISSACGFSDYHYFTKVFEKQTGCRPLEYRTHLRNEACSL